MNFVELPCRFLSKVDKDILDEIDALVETEQMLKGDSFDADAYRNELLDEHKQYEYDNMVVDLSEIFSFNAVDSEHTFVRFLNGTAMAFKVNYHDFMAILVESTQRVIKTLNTSEEDDRSEK